MLTILFWICVYLAVDLLPASQLVNVIIIVLYCFFLLRLINKNNEFFLTASFFIWSYSTTAISCLILEYGVFLPELTEYSTAINATAKNLSLVVIFLMSSSFLFDFLRNRLPINFNISSSGNALLGKIYVPLYISGILILYFLFIKYGSPSSYGQDRFYYWNNVAPVWGNSVRLFVEQSSFIIGCIYAHKRNKALLFFFFCGLLAQILVGEKFTGIFQMLLFFIIAAGIVMNLQVKKALFNFRYALVWIIGLPVLIYIIWTSYYSISGDASLALASLNTRLAAQSQMWWAVLNVSDNLRITIDDVMAHFAGLGKDEYNAGMYYLMEKIMPYSLFNVYKDAGIALTMAFPTNLLFFFGNVGAILAVLILGFFFATALWFLFYTIKNKDFVLTYFSMKSFYIMIQVALMGRAYILFEWKVLLFLLPFTLVVFSQLNKSKESNIA